MKCPAFKFTRLISYNQFLTKLYLHGYRLHPCFMVGSLVILIFCKNFYWIFVFLVIIVSHQIRHIFQLVQFKIHVLMTPFVFRNCHFHLLRQTQLVSTGYLTVFLSHRWSDMQKETGRKFAISEMFVKTWRDCKSLMKTDMSVWLFQGTEVENFSSSSSSSCQVLGQVACYNAIFSSHLIIGCLIDLCPLTT
jgi:hypothetical protein